MNNDFAAPVGNALKFVSAHGRTLDAARISYLFQGGPGTAVVDALAAFQNRDGGFGNGLEPDFLLPDSSPMATSVAFQIADELDLPSNNNMITSGIGYLWNKYDASGPGWEPVPASVNSYPHAPWWHWSKNENWGNPTAELAGYIVKYTQWGENPQAIRLVDATCDYLLKSPDEMECHELYCFLRFSETLPAETSKKLESRLGTLIKAAICLEPGEWTSYKPQPIDFIWTKDSPFYESYRSDIQRNIEFLLSTVSSDGAWYPTWSWGDSFPRDWEKARLAWAGALAVKHLRAIHAFA